MFLLFKVPVDPADSRHIAAWQRSTQCSASGLRLCFLCSAKMLKLKGNLAFLHCDRWKESGRGPGWRKI
jgi:hypothetical protein